jgi:hypothetical protein
MSFGVGVVQASQGELLKIVATAHSARRFAGCLNGGQEERHENADDRDHDQQFNQGESVPSPKLMSKPVSQHSANAEVPCLKNKSGVRE